MKRQLVNLLLFLLVISAGAIINVAVAWGCVCCIPSPGFGERIAHPDEMLPFLDTDDASRVELWSLVTDSAAIGSIARNLGARRVSCDACAGRSCVYTLVCAGVPYDTLFGWRLDSSFQPPRISLLARTSLFGARDFPLRPIWPGFAINTMFYAAVAWMLLRFRSRSGAGGASSAASVRRAGILWARVHPAPNAVRCWHDP